MERKAKKIKISAIGTYRSGSLQSLILYRACPARCAWGCCAALREGEPRYTSAALPTRYRFTGQPEEASLGLYDYGVRWYEFSPAA